MVVCAAGPRVAVVCASTSRRGRPPRRSGASQPTELDRSGTRVQVAPAGAGAAAAGAASSAATGQAPADGQPRGDGAAAASKRSSRAVSARDRSAADGGVAGGSGVRATLEQLLMEQQAEKERLEQASRKPHRVVSRAARRTPRTAAAEEARLAEDAAATAASTSTSGSAMPPLRRVRQKHGETRTVQGVWLAGMRSALDGESTSLRSMGNTDSGITRGVLSREAETQYVTLAQAAMKLEKLQEDLSREQGAPVSLEQLAHAANLSKGELQRRLGQGQAARSIMVDHNIRLVASVARKYWTNTGGQVPLSDLMQEGVLGLLRGLAKFDTSRGFKFSTYCHWWIRQSVMRALGDQSRTIRVPVYVYEDYNRMRRVARTLTSELGRDPTFAELAERAGSTPAKVEALMRACREVTSGDVEVSGTSRSPSTGNTGRAGRYLLDTVPAGEGGSLTSGDADSFEAAHDVQWLRADLAAVLDTLEERERFIVSQTFGLMTDEHGEQVPPMSVMEISRGLGITRERVRQITETALHKLGKRSSQLLTHLPMVDEGHY